MAALTDLVSVRSQRAERLRAHLEWLAAGRPWPTPPWHLRDGAPDADAVYVAPDVYLHDPERRPRNAAHDAELARAPGADHRGRTAWSEEWHRLRTAHRLAPACVVMLGRPGEGKSTLAQRTCRDMAASSLALWRARLVPLDQIPIPIWLTAAQVVAAGSVGAALKAARLAAGEAASDSAALHPVAPDGLTAEELVAAPEAPTTWVFIDALDEAPRAANLAVDDLARRTSTTWTSLRALRCDLLLTVRTYAWDLFKQQLGGRERDTPTTGPTVYDLAPLSDDQRRRVVEGWHAAGTEPRVRLLELLDVAPMRELTNNALLLTLLCSAALVPGRSISRNTRRAELYGWLVHDMVAREDKTGHVPGSAIVHYRVALLERAVWRLWLNHPPAGDDRDNGHLQFSHADWVAALERAATAPEAGAPPRDLAGRLDALRECVEAAGLLVKNGAETLSFFPATVHEYLAGAGLVEQAALDQLAFEPDAATTLVVNRFVEHGADTRWRELIMLAIGHLGVVRRKPTVLNRIVNATLDALVTASTDHRGAVAVVVAGGLLLAGDQDPRLCPLGLGGDATMLLTPKVRELLCTTLLEFIRAPFHRREAAEGILAWLGDPRFDADAFWLPRATSTRPALGFVHTLAGVFMARWPSTTAQWAAYLAATGRKAVDVRSLAGAPTNPVTFVSAEEAEAYCAWLTSELSPHGQLAGLGWTIAEALRTDRVVARLATEAEWMAGTNEGDADDPSLTGNGRSLADVIDESARRFIWETSTAEGIEATEEVGSVNEWTSSAWSDNHRGASLTNDARRVMCGNPFHRWERRINVSGFHPTFGYGNIGFRVVVAGRVDSQESRESQNPPQRKC